MTASFKTNTRTALKVGDFVRVTFSPPPGSVGFAVLGVGRVTKSPVRSDDDQHEVLGVSELGQFRRDFPRSDLTRLVPVAATDNVAHPSKEELVDAFRTYLTVTGSAETRRARNAVVKAYLASVGVDRAVDLPPEQRAAAITFVEGLPTSAEELIHPKRQHIDPEKGKRADDNYRSALRSLAESAEVIAAEFRSPRYEVRLADLTPEQTGQYLRAEAGAIRPAAGYSPYRLTNEQLQLAIDNAMEVIRKGLGPGIHAGEPETICALLEEHLADLLEIQRERAGGA